MFASLPVLAALCAAPAPAPIAEIATELWQVAPNGGGKPWAPPSTPSDRARAVVLIPGLHLHPLRPGSAARAERRPWQEPKSELVKALAKDFDVFAFSYAQTVPVDEVSQSPGLRDAVARIRKAGYRDIVLVGHSAGGLIARQFVEQHPDAGVTKVVAVASPFAGSDLAALKVGYPKAQTPFVHSLTPEARKEAASANPQPLGKDVGFACVVCKIKRTETDGVVLARSQWPEELQRLGVPVALATVSHFEAMQNPAAVKVIAELAREKLTRWSPEEVEKARKVLVPEKKANVER